MKRILGSRRSGLFVAAVLLAAGTCTVPARAAGTSTAPILQAFQAMYTANSFRATTTIDSSSQSYSSQSIGEMIVVRQGQSFAIYLKSSTHQKMFGKSSTQVLEIVSTASHSCTRAQQHGAWSCQRASGSLFTSGFTPDALRKAATQLKQVTALGTATVDGQPCSGYGFMETREKVTLWISVATQRPVQLRMGNQQASSGQTALSMQITEDFSDWNDPSLKIPAV